MTLIVNANYRMAEVFRKYNIDFCCGGKMSLTRVCELQAINESELLEELGEYAIIYKNAKQRPVDFMINYLINIHHNYFKNSDPIVHALYR